MQAVSEEHIALFRHGLKCFFEEGKTLARIQHPNIVRVLNFFRANDTVYMVMEYERGRTLQKEIQINHEREGVDEKLIRSVFYNLLNGLREVHLNKLLHLDIKPANIYIRKDGSPVLLDFGSARQSLTTEHSRLTPMYTPGFAAPEQYRKKEQLGPWTDIYGIGASMFACIAGTAPQAADGREKEDKVQRLEVAYGDRYSPELLSLIHQCIEIDHEKRPQSVLQIQKLLLEPGSAPSKKSNLISTLKRKWIEISRPKNRDNS